MFIFVIDIEIIQMYGFNMLDNIKSFIKNVFISLVVLWVRVLRFIKAHKTTFLICLSIIVIMCILGALVGCHSLVDIRGNTDSVISDVAPCVDVF